VCLGLLFFGIFFVIRGFFWCFSCSSIAFSFCLSLRLFDNFIHFLCFFGFNSTLFAHNFSETSVRKQTNAWINTHEMEQMTMNANEWMLLFIWLRSLLDSVWKMQKSNKKRPYTTLPVVLFPLIWFDLICLAGGEAETWLLKFNDWLYCSPVNKQMGENQSIPDLKIPFLSI